jgi:hypothetical protein
MKLDFSITRELNLDEGGKINTITASIGGIDQMKSGEYACYFEIPSVSRGRKKIYGEDPVQALTLCLKHVGELLRLEMESRNVEIWWAERGDHGGF